MVYHSPQTLPELQQEALNDILSDIVIRLNDPRIPKERRKPLVEAVFVQLGNALGTDMSGQTYYDTTPNAPAAKVKEIGELLGTKPDVMRNRLYVAPFERSQPAAACVVTCRDANDDLRVLLVRHKAGPRHERWEVPAGYRDPMPASDIAVSGRLDSEQQSARDEAQATGMALAAQQGASSLKQVAIPRKDIRRAATEIYQETLTQKGWQGVAGLEDDSAAQRAALRAKGVELPDNPVTGKAFDLTARDNALREAFEESGLNVADYPNAKVSRVCHQAGLISPNLGKLAQLDHDVYLVDLGTLDALPPLSPQDKGEIGEAQWVRVKDIGCHEHHFQVKQPAASDGVKLPLAPTLGAIVDEALAHKLDADIKEASKGMMDSVADVYQQRQTWIGKTVSLPNTKRVLDQHPLNAETGKLPTLLGSKHGVYDSIVATAAGLSANMRDRGSYEWSTKVATHINVLATPQQPEQNSGWMKRCLQQVASAIGLG